MKIHGCEIQDISMSISILNDLTEICESDGDERDKRLEARDLI